MNEKLIKTLEGMHEKTQDALSKLSVLQTILIQLDISGVCVCSGMTGAEFTGILQQVILDVKSVNDTLQEMLSKT